ncbi:MAG TPA: oligosaccharide flippase family protein, partial [Terriglobia bacterium]|nr:oligosaccharide flippase family protein [Terriglobia bacterium]
MNGTEQSALRDQTLPGGWTRALPRPSWLLGTLPRAQLARNTIWALLGSGLSQGASLIAALMLGRMLELTMFGQLALIQTTVLLFGNLGEAGLTLTTTKFVGRWKERDPGRAGRLVGWSMRATAISGLFMVVLLIVAAPRLGSFPADAAPLAFAGAGGLLIFEMMNRLQFGALAGLESFRQTSHIQLGRALILLPIVWAGVTYRGLGGALAGMAVVSLATFLIGNRVLRRECALRAIPLDGARFERGVLATSASLWISTVLLTGSTWAVMMLLTRQSSGYDELGLFNAADRWKIALLFLPNVLFQVVLPMLSRSHAAGDHRACRQIVSMAILLVTGVTGTAALAVYLLSPLLMSWYGRSFEVGNSVLAVAAIGSVATALYTVGSGVLWSLGRPTLMLAIDLFKAALVVGLCLAGFGGTAWNVMVAYL